jgi:hypothetical protein
LPPDPSQARRPPLTPRTPPAAARITGAAAAAGDAAEAEEFPPSSESATGAADSAPEEESGDGTDGTSTDPGVTPGVPATPDTTELGRGWRTPELAAAPATSGESFPLATDGDPLPDPADPDPRRPDPATDPATDPAADPWDARACLRAGDDVVAGVPGDEDDADDPVEPADPVVSANATGAHATAEPTPNATANAPTRPIWAATLRVADSVTVAAGRLYSMGCTRLAIERR